MQEPPAKIGATLDEIDTPALIVDLDAFERNLKKMADYAAAAGIALRAHAKTHKCSIVAKRQMALGAVGQCVQKVGEAEVLARAGIPDILVSNELVGAAKLDRLAALAQQTRIALCFDDAEQVAAASSAAKRAGVELGALVEIEVGMGRCGVQPGRAAAELAQRVADAPGLRFEGLQAYHGRAQHLSSAAERESEIARAVAAVRETQAALAAAGLPTGRVTGAGTGTFRLEAESGVYDELQAGSYAFMDVEYASIAGRDGQPYHEFEHSLFVLASVMSVAGPAWIVADAGLKSMSGEKGPPRVYGRSGLDATGLSDEHCKIALAPGAQRPRLGERLLLIPGHCDPTINLHDWYVGVRAGRVAEMWPIDARGASR
jgi:D-serine deaminase-like pyridoxal phosphate-dependent protein